MAVRRARIITLVALLGGISALAVFCTPPAAQQVPDELRAQAEQGNATAQVELGFMSATGEGAPQDAAEAVRWFRLAADQRLAAAQSTLGVMYANGSGVPQDAVEAYKWFSLAAAQSSGEVRANSVQGRDTVAGRMTAAQVAAAQRRAREWQPTPAPCSGRNLSRRLDSNTDRE